MRHGRTDANQTEIVRALRDVGAFVQSLADLGHGVPDLLVGFRGKWFVFEVKTNNGKLTPDETDWHGRACAPVFIARGVDEALRMIGAIE